MPRITGPTIAEHVAAQEAAVVAAARRLFSERGVAAVSLGDIATEVGLRRTSLYRYFPTKAHILQRWFDAEMDALIERSHEVLAQAESSRAGLLAWLDVQWEFVSDDEHVALVDAFAGSSEMPPEVRDHFGQRHRDLYATLDSVLRDGGARTTEIRRVRALLVAGLIRSSADLLGHGARPAGVRRELHRAASAVAGF